MKDGTKTVFLVIGALLIILGLFMLIPYLVEITIGDKSHNFLFWSFFSIFRGLNRIYPRPQIFTEFTDLVLEKLKEHIPEWFNTSKITMTDEEVVNGYKLYDTSKLTGLWFRYDYFLELEKLFNKENTMNEEEFYEKYDDIACSDWSKQDEHGECFGGFWKYPEGSYEKKNAYTLSRDANGKALYKLPYSHALIFETIEYGCGNRQESVRYSNFMCEYVKRIIALKIPNQETKAQQTQELLTQTLKKIEIVHNKNKSLKNN